MRTIKRTRTRNAVTKAKARRKENQLKSIKHFSFIILLGMKENQCLKRFRLLHGIAVDVFGVNCDVQYYYIVRLRFFLQYFLKLFLRFLFFDRLRNFLFIFATLLEFLYFFIIQFSNLNFLMIFCLFIIILLRTGFHSHTIALSPVYSNSVVY